MKVQVTGGSAFGGEHHDDDRVVLHVTLADQAQ